MTLNSENQSTGDPSAHFRSRRRAANHLSAHDSSLISRNTDSFKHPLVPQGIRPITETQADLEKLIDTLRIAGSFAYDSEFIGESSYHPQLCLIQIATDEFVALIDPMADVDLRPFWELLADPSVEKLVHAGEQDLEPVVRHLQRPAKNVFDTQVSAGFAAMAFPSSLAKLVLEFTGVRLGKGLTFTDWSQRPLSDVQMRYAADDVRYLPMIVSELKKKLIPLGHLDWALAESAAMGDPSRFLFDIDSDYLRVRGSGSLMPENLAVLRELTAWRDRAAEAADMPPRAYLRDEVMLSLARSPVKSASQFAKIRNLPRPVEANEGEAIIAASQRGHLSRREPSARTDRRTIPKPTICGRFALGSRTSDGSRAFDRSGTDHESTGNRRLAPPSVRRD